MNSSVRKITINVFSLTMIVVMGIFIVNKGIYTHSHKLENGSVLTHAHPFNKSNDSSPHKSHHHSIFEFLFLENLNLIFFSAFVIISFYGIFRIKHPNFNRNKIVPFSFLSLLSGRAPPSI